MIIFPDFLNTFVLLFFFLRIVFKVFFIGQAISHFHSGMAEVEGGSHIRTFKTFVFPRFQEWQKAHGLVWPFMDFKLKRTKKKLQNLNNSELENYLFENIPTTVRHVIALNELFQNLLQGLLRPFAKFLSYTLKRRKDLSKGAFFPRVLHRVLGI